MPDTSVLARSTLIGRVAELQQLHQYLLSARETQGHAVLVNAPAGMGKSRLLHEFALAAQAQGFYSFVGRAFELEADFPYAIIADAFQPHLRAHPEQAAGLAQGIPELGALLPAIGSAGSRATSKIALFEAFLTFLGRLAAQRPVLLVLEDVHWADPASLELIHHIARQLSRMPVLLLMACRSDEHATKDALQGVTGSLSRAGHLSTMLLGPLGEADVAEMVRQLLPTAYTPARDLVAQLDRETGGNPFFLEEILKAMVQERVLVPQDGRWHLRSAEPLTVPSTIREAILSRLVKLAPGERHLLDVASAFGSRIPLRTLRVLIEMDEMKLADALDHMLTLQILEEEADFEGATYKFTHPKIQQAIYIELSAARRQAIHGFIATRLEMLYQPAPDQHADDLALHFGLSAEPQHLARSIAYGIAAGDRAVALFAYQRAASQYLQALLGDEQAGGVLSPEQKFDLLDKLGNTYEKIGDFTAAAEFWDHALGLAHAAAGSSRIAILYSNLARVHWEHGDGARALRYCDQGLAVLTGAGLDGPIECALHHERFEILLRLGGALQASQAVCMEMEAAGRSGSALAMAIAQGDSAAFALWTGDVSSAARDGSAALAVLQREPGVEVALHSLHVTLAWAFWGMGHTEVGREHAEAALSVSHRWGLTALQGSPLLILALMDLEAGSLQRAAAVARQAVDVYRSHKSPSLGFPLAVLALVTALLDEPDGTGSAEAEEMTARFFAETPSIEGIMAYCTLGRYKLVCGDLAGGQHYYERAGSLVERLGYTFMLAAPQIGVGKRNPPAVSRRSPSVLTKRELDVAREVCRHKTDKEIAAALHLSVRTVTTHLTHIYTKLNIHARTQLVEYGLQVGLEGDV